MKTIQNYSSIKLKTMQAEIHQLSYVYPKQRPLFMSSEMEDLKGHFLRLENGQKSINENIVDIEKIQEKMNAKIELMDDTLSIVKNALTGNTNVGMRGLADRVEEIEKRQKEYDKIYYKVIGAGIIIGIIYPVISKAVNALIDKM